MPGDFLKGVPQLTMRQFHAFRDERPKEEKWELIDGVPMMMPPPTLMHQRISGNLEARLNQHLADVKPDWRADREIGVSVPDDDKYNPEPDVTVIDTEIGHGQIYATRFYAVAEVLSPNDKPDVLVAKLAYYQTHENCLAVLFVRQDRIEAELHRREDGAWRARTQTGETDSLDLPQIGAIGQLRELYRFTPLLPAPV